MKKRFCFFVFLWVGCIVDEQCYYIKILLDNKHFKLICLRNRNIKFIKQYSSPDILNIFLILHQEYIHLEH